MRILNSQEDVCLICIVDCSFIIAPQERIAIENAFSNIKKIGIFNRVKSRGASYEYNELTYFILAACVLHHCEIQFDFTKWLRAYSSAAMQMYIVDQQECWEFRIVKQCK